MKRYVYIAGPYTKGDVAKNVRSAITEADRLANRGYIPYIPHLTHFWHMIRPHDYEFWIEYDLAWLEKCDYLVRLDGESPGADNEVSKAIEMGKPVYLGVSSFLLAHEESVANT